MRHDDSSKRPRVDPAQNPRLAAALSRLSQGVREDREARSARSETPPPPAPLPRDLTPSLGAPGSDLYIPGDDDVELLDGGEQHLSPHGQDDDESEMTPSDSELELVDLPPGQAASNYATPGRGAYGADGYDPVDTAGADFDPSALPEGSLFDGGDPAGGPLSAELIVDPSMDRPSEGRVSLPPSIRPGGVRPRDPAPEPEPEPDFEPEADLEAEAEAEADPEAYPEADAEADPAAEPGEESPWAADGEAAIDASALPSAHSPVALPRPPPKPQPVAEPTSGSRSWVTLFLVIALVASGTTFLALRFNLGQRPEDAPGAGPPIQVPTNAPAAPRPTQAAQAAQPADPPPVDPALANPPATAAPDPSAAAAADPTAAPPGDPAAPTATIVTSPAGPGTGPRPVFTASKPGGPTPPSSKKPSRIF